MRRPNFEGGALEDKCAIIYEIVYKLDIGVYCMYNYLGEWCWKIKSLSSGFDWRIITDDGVNFNRLEVFSEKMKEFF